MDDAQSSPKCERREVQLVAREEGPAREEASWRGEGSPSRASGELEDSRGRLVPVVQLQVDDHVMSR
jgi:hypothetical protein